MTFSEDTNWRILSAANDMGTELSRLRAAARLVVSAHMAGDDDAMDLAVRVLEDAADFEGRA